MKHLTRNSGLYLWTATVAATWPGKPRTKLKLFAFCDTREEAIEAVCEDAKTRGYIAPTVNHIAQHTNVLRTRHFR